MHISTSVYPFGKESFTSCRRCITVWWWVWWFPYLALFHQGILYIQPAKRYTRCAWGWFVLLLISEWVRVCLCGVCVCVCVCGWVGGYLNRWTEKWNKLLLSLSNVSLSFQHLPIHEVLEFWSQLGLFFLATLPEYVPIALVGLHCLSVFVCLRVCLCVCASVCAHKLGCVSCTSHLLLYKSASALLRILARGFLSPWVTDDNSFCNRRHSHTTHPWIITTSDTRTHPTPNNLTNKPNPILKNLGPTTPSVFDAIHFHYRDYSRIGFRSVWLCVWG